MAWKVGTIDEDNVGVAVVIVVDKCATRAHGFGEPFLSKGAVVVLKVDSRLRSDVAEGDWLRESREWQQIERGKNEGRTKAEFTHYWEAPETARMFFAG